MGVSVAVPADDEDVGDAGLAAAGDDVGQVGPVADLLGRQVRRHRVAAAGQRTARSTVASWPLAGEAVTVSRTSRGTLSSTACSVFLNGMTSYPREPKTCRSEARAAGSRTVMARFKADPLSVRRSVAGSRRECPTAGARQTYPS